MAQTLLTSVTEIGKCKGNPRQAGL